MPNIRYQKGDIFEATTQVIVNTVNCKGVMGKGLALAFKQRYPEMFSVYQQECKSGRLRIGRPTLYTKSTPWILNFPTKDNWKANSKIEYLEKGLEYFVNNYKQAGITSIAFPKLGVQNGKLSWDEVGPLMVKYLSQIDIDVHIYIANGDTEYQYDAQANSKMEAAIWEQFSEVALSLDRLQQEVSLSLREAKKIFNQRNATTFSSLADIEAIETLAETALKKIKHYINLQRHAPAELPGMETGNKLQPKIKNKRQRSSKQKKQRGKTRSEETQTDNLFSPLEMTNHIYA